MRLKVVLLGATGFVGRHIGRALRDRGVEVVAVSTSTATPVDLSHPAGREHLACLLAAERPVALVNSAGKAWQADEQQMYRANATLVENLTGAVAAQAEPPRLVHIGTIHEYGQGRPGRGFREDDRPEPTIPYGRSKLLGTQAALAAGGTVLRVSNVSGPGTPPGSLLRGVADHLAICAKAQANGEPLSPLVYRSLAAWRDFVDVRDVAAAVLAAITAPGEDIRGETFNIGRGVGVQMRRLVNLMVELSGLPVPVVEQDPFAGEDWLTLDTTKAGDRLGWTPAVTHERSLRDLMEL
ncbi:MAG TPA: NAD(P)-dependent oxidoreductase [Candidatus Limnocylindrales bacterium]|nr:NAD(P)-dependent oxidoreductase [Candidatus Limnocylindrales bacterium]